MKVWVVIIQCDEMSPSYEIAGIFGTEQKAKDEITKIYDENPDMDIYVSIEDHDVY